jgi:hypothetical protein
MGVVREIKIPKKLSDDIKMGQTVATLEQREKKQHAIDNLIAWADKWGIAFNVAKCKVMHFGFNNPCHTFMYHERTTAGRDGGGEGYRCHCHAVLATIRTVRQSGKDCRQSDGANESNSTHNMSGRI